MAEETLEELLEKLGDNMTWLSRLSDVFMRATIHGKRWEAVASDYAKYGVGAGDTPTEAVKNLLAKFPYEELDN